MNSWVVPVALTFGFSTIVGPPGARAASTFPEFSAPTDSGPVSLDGNLSPGLALADRDPGNDLGKRLRYAARVGRMKTLRALVESENAVVDSRGEYGETALQTASRWGQLRAVEFLLTHGADPDLANDAGETPLIQAAKDCAHRTIMVLLKAGARPDSIDRFGRSAIFFPAEGGCLNATRALLDGAPRLDLSRRDDSGRTALDYALEAAQTEVGGPFSEIAKLLLSQGADYTEWFPANEFTLGPEPGNARECKSGPAKIP